MVLVRAAASASNAVLPATVAAVSSTTTPLLTRRSATSSSTSSPGSSSYSTCSTSTHLRSTTPARRTSSNPLVRSNSLPHTSRPATATAAGARAARSFSSSAVQRASVKDPYGTLGVKRDASAKDIKSAYYALAKKHHPDTNKDKGSQEKFVEIQSAYDILSDPKKKQAFDQYGSTDGNPGFDPFGGQGGFGGGGQGGFQGFGGGFPGGFGGAGGASASDIFENLFGGAFGGAGGRRGQGAGFAGETRGEDLEVGVSITFEEACRGTSRTVTTTPVERCQPCSGAGLKAGARKSTCGTCGGTGTRTFVIQGGFQMASTCPACGGSGTSVRKEDQCPSCEGVGRVRGRRSVEVKIPPGVDDGAQVRVDAAGDVPLQGSGKPGALYVRISVKPSKIWRRQGSNLYFPAALPVHTAMLGGRVRVPTLDGDVELRVPAGTQVGDEMLLRGRGVPNVMRKGDKGDLLVQFDVQIPRSLSPRQRELLQMYADDVEGRARPAPAAAPQQPPPPPPSSSNPPPASDNTKADSGVASEPKAGTEEAKEETSKEEAAAKEEEAKDTEKEKETKA